MNSRVEPVDEHPTREVLAIHHASVPTVAAHLQIARHPRHVAEGFCLVVGRHIKAGAPSGVRRRSFENPLERRGSCRLTRLRLLHEGVR